MQVGERFLIHQWSDGCAVFDQTSGNTHSLDVASCAGFFAALNDESASLAIEKAICLQWPDMSAAEVAGQVGACLERLQSCGLLEAGMPN